MLNNALYPQLFWSSHTHILFKGCYSTLLKQYRKRAHCLGLVMPLECVCVCVSFLRLTESKQTSFSRLGAYHG